MMFMWSFYKFMLKRILGNLVKGDLNLDNIDVQLTSGLVQLLKLQLNEEVRTISLIRAIISKTINASLSEVNSPVVVLEGEN